MSNKTILRFSLSLLGNSLICSVISFIVFYSASAVTKAAWFMRIITIVNVAILCAILYNRSWNEAYRDRNRVKYGHMNKFLSKGIVGALLSEVPAVVAYILYAAMMKSDVFYMIYLIFTIPFLSWVTAFKENLPLLALLFLPIPAISGIGYLFGWKEFTIMDRLVYKRKKSTDDSAAAGSKKL